MVTPMSDMPLLPEDAREIWVAKPARDAGARLRKHDLVRQVKRIVEATALLDLDGSDDASLVGLITEAAGLADALDSHPSLRRQGGLSMAGGDDGVLVERSGISGRSNPLAPPMFIDMSDPDITRAHAVWTDAYEGPPHSLHGGFVAAAFDDLLGCAQMASGYAGFTGTLTVKMIRPTPLNRRIDYEAGVTDVEGRKIRCWGTAKDGDELLAEADCLFIRPKSGLS
jgi:acyl-coenzyme A thioesterase PaaI-like protein